VVYLDSSAIVKLVVGELESSALHGSPAVTRARQVLRRIDLVSLDDELLNDAALLDMSLLSSLDAIHLAAARAFGDELTAVVTYDERMSTAAARLGLAVDSPR